MVHWRGGRAALDEDVYPDLDGFWADLTRRIATRYVASASSAARTCQLDRHEPRLPQRPRQRSDVGSIGGDPSGSSVEYIRTSTRGHLPADPRGSPSQRICVRGLPLFLGRRGRLRARRRRALPRARGQWLLHGVGRRALRRLRAASACAAGSRSSSGRDDQARRAREQGRAQRHIDEASHHVPIGTRASHPEWEFSTVEGSRSPTFSKSRSSGSSSRSQKKVWGRVESGRRAGTDEGGGCSTGPAPIIQRRPSTRAAFSFRISGFTSSFNPASS